MKAIIVALGVILFWNAALTGVVLYQRQQILDDGANIGVLSQNQVATYDQLDKVTKALNKTTRAQNKTAVRESKLEDAVIALLKALKAASEEQPSSLNKSRWRGEYDLQRQFDVSGSYSSYVSY